MRAEKLKVGSWKLGGWRGVVCLVGVLGLVMAGVVRGDWERLWMVWGEPQADAGRARARIEAVEAWSNSRVLEGRVALRKSATASLPETIPMPREAGSWVGSVEVLPEGAGRE